MIVGGGLTEEQMKDKIMEDYRNQAYESYDQNMDGCPNCGRTFRSEALVKHLKNCTSKKPLFKPRPGFVPKNSSISETQET